METVFGKKFCSLYVYQCYVTFDNLLIYHFCVFIWDNKLTKKIKQKELVYIEQENPRVDGKQINSGFIVQTMEENICISLLIDDPNNEDMTAFHNSYVRQMEFEAVHALYFFLLSMLFFHFSQVKAKKQNNECDIYVYYYDRHFPGKAASKIALIKELLVMEKRICPWTNNKCALLITQDDKVFLSFYFLKHK
ncbi:hypothetical protein RFI_33966 [Reticulomyxa filosa]|uniref:Uncharacterized protein n=1 Tax=Reticulomyxa filosa TaxID=46433 RepID=X6LPB0_RETFI|nr:hypothetical protein RFI_33966 [Reticulomyxa filosa]|eukprot:ETO03439.1 hypothetical protein RFI_33966 [Reticulomyxa filosa]